jgi:hypothetical protein
MKTLCALIVTAWLATSGCSSTADRSFTGDGSAGAAGGASGGGGTGGAAGATALSCGDGGGPVDPTALIDDMEATDPQIAMIGGRCGSLHAMHVTGQGFTSWAELTASLRYGAVDGGTPGLLPYDAHTRTGITFWARIGDTSAAQVRLAVSDKYSRPEGGVCDVNAATGPTACYDTFGVDLTPIGTTWTQYQIPFAGLGQRNFGLQEPSVDTSAVYSIDFNFYPGETFSLWVDDIAFY